MIAPSVEEAIEKGLQDLGLTEADIDVEILDEGKKGLLGLGSRQARIALKIKGSPSDVTQTEEKSTLFEKKIDQEQTLEDLEAPGDSEEVSIARETINILLDKMLPNLQG